MFSRFWFWTVVPAMPVAAALRAAFAEYVPAIVVVLAVGIVVLGSEPELYFYAHRKSATGYIYMYPLMEKQKFASQMQREMISDIERNRPKYLVNVSSSLSWLKTDDSDKTIFEWMRKDFAAGHWRLEGVVDASDFGSESVWGAQAAAYQPRSRNIMQVYRRM